MKCCLHPLAAFGYSLVGQPDDVHVDLARRDHHLHVDRHGLDALESNRANPRHHVFTPDAAFAPSLCDHAANGVTGDNHRFPAKARTFGERLNATAAMACNAAAREARLVALLLHRIPEQAGDVGATEALHFAYAGR